MSPAETVRKRKPTRQQLALLFAIRDNGGLDTPALETGHTLRTLQSCERAGWVDGELTPAGVAVLAEAERRDFDDCPNP